MRELVAELATEIPSADEWDAAGASSPRDLLFKSIDPSIAADITQRFHYLRSPRTDGVAFGLVEGRSNRVGALCVISPLDVGHLSSLLISCGRSPERAAVLSRVFAFEGMPRNTLSYLLSRASDEVRRNGVRDLVTYVNPNVGFTGVSYRASGWALLGDEPGTTYRYLDGRYITDRELRALCGEVDDTAVRARLGGRFAVSKMALQPLLVFGRSLR